MTPEWLKPVGQEEMPTDRTWLTTSTHFCLGRWFFEKMAKS